MKRTVKPNRGQAGKPATFKGRPVAAGRIHPVITYPFRPTGGYRDLQALYSLVERLAADPKKYARPITVMDRKTYYSQRKAASFQA